MRQLIVTIFLLCVSSYAKANIVFPSDFFFGIANAPAHVEDNLSDIWTDFAEQGGVAAFNNQTAPTRRLDFWSHPEVELDLAKELGVQVFRIGVDWQRLQPKPGGELDVNALLHYRKILEMIHARGMKVMLTLFHHSEPRWTFNRGSWSDEAMSDDFVYFAQEVVSFLHDKVDYLITFNEAQVYVLLTQVAGVWPYNGSPKGLRLFDFGPFKGAYTRSLKNIADAHKRVFNWIKKSNYKMSVSVAHNVSYHKGSSLVYSPFAAFSRKRMNYFFIDLIKDSLDFLGINYYGIEVVKGAGVTISDKYEYSDSGRGVSPLGFYKTLKSMHHRYRLPMIITENGVADSSDWLRPAYLVEHLKALKQVMLEGVKVLGYVHWTLSDNWEWADGYCPKFGLVAVDRDNDLKRIKRDSFYFYQSIIKNNSITHEQADHAWSLVTKRTGVERDFCRSSDGVSALDEPILIPAKNIDWRFHIKL